MVRLHEWQHSSWQWHGSLVAILAFHRGQSRPIQRLNEVVGAALAAAATAATAATTVAAAAAIGRGHGVEIDNGDHELQHTAHDNNKGGTVSRMYKHFELRLDPALEHCVEGACPYEPAVLIPAVLGVDQLQRHRLRLD